MKRLIVLSWKNLHFDRLKSLLSICIMGLGLGLICFFMVFSSQVEENFRNNLAGVHLVLGAKGSPLQLVLCNLYHADVPTGNITIDDAKAFLNPKHPLLSHGVPLSLGDSYRGHRLVGTTHDFLDLYSLQLLEGDLFEKDMEVVIGSMVAREQNLRIGDEFQSSHGLGIEESLAESHKHDFVVKGILRESGTVADDLILCTPSSFWLVHEEGHQHSDNHEHNHAHFNITEKSDLLIHGERSVTSMLLRFRAKNIQSLNMMRSINENTPLMAASPSFELNKLFDQLGIGFDVLRSVAVLILFISALSIWFGMSISLQERKYELALIRSIGGQPYQLSLLIIFEAIWVAVLGYIIAMVLFYSLIWISNNYWASDWGFGSIPIKLYVEQGLVLGLGFIIAVLSVLVPIVQVLRLDIARILSER
jgi:putative ABC transport system permease protein